MSRSAKLLTLVFVMLAAVFALAGFYKAGLEAAMGDSGWLAETLKYGPYRTADGDLTMYDLGKAFRRFIYITAFLLFLILRKWVPWGWAARHGFARAKGMLRELGFGMFWGLAVVVVYGAILIFADRAEFKDFRAGVIFGEIAKYLFVGLLIGLFEEYFFRGVMFRTMLSDWGVGRAMIVSSAIYAWLHCFYGRALVPTGFDLFAGVRLLGDFYTDEAGSALPVVQLFVGLFLLGVILSYLYLRTGALYAPIGLHAGVVLFSKVHKKLICRADNIPEWLYGDREFIVSGVACWIVALALLYVFTRIAPRGPLYRRLAAGAKRAVAPRP